MGRKVQQSREKHPSIQEVVLSRIRRDSPRTVEALLASVAVRDPSLTSEQILHAVKELRSKGKVELSRPNPNFQSFKQYLSALDWSVSLWAALLGTIAVSALVYLIPQVTPWTVFRWILGGVLVLYLPGNGLAAALFPEEQSLSFIERIAMSIGLSLAIVPTTGLLLNYTPLGIRLNPILAFLSLFTISVHGVAGYRRYASLRSQVVGADAKC